MSAARPEGIAMRSILFLLFVSFSAVAQAHPLVDAAQRGDMAAIRCMIESGVCPEVRNKHGETALMEACDEDRPEIVAYLLKNGADINACDYQGENAFHEAIEEFLGKAKRAHHEGGGMNDDASPAVLNVLMADPRLDVNAADTFGRTPLMLFAEAGKADWVARLLKIGATVGDVDRLGRTALDRSTDATVQKLLKERGAN